MVVGTAERHIQIFNLTNPNTAYKVRAAFYIDFLQLTTFLDYHITSKVANARCFLFYDITHQQWLCCG